jgi:phosphatidylserine/phosphatidylglycerophosphate/cardiolipin synthase-like enzyme
MGRLPENTHLVSRSQQIVVVLMIFLLMSSACGPSEQNLRTPTPGATDVVAANWYSIYFTQPTSPTARSYRGGPDESLAAAIDQARVSVDMAVYDLNLWSIRDALVSAYQRGITVRVVTESDNMRVSRYWEIAMKG